MLDLSTDTNKAYFVKLAQQYDFPEFVKKADVEELASPTKFSACADTVEQKFSCHSKPATWVSSLYYLTQRDSLSPVKQATVERRLKNFATMFGIADEYDALCEKFKYSEKAAAEKDLSDDDFAYIATRGEVKYREMPITTPNEIKQAANWLESHRDDLIFAERHSIANRILSKAQQTCCGLDNTDYIVKQAGYGVGSAVDVSEMFRRRAVLATGEQKQQLEKLANDIAGVSDEELSFRDLAKIAELVDAIDHNLGVTYDAYIKRPEDVIFANSATKWAEEKEEPEACEECCFPNGDVFDIKELMKTPFDEIAKAFDTEFASVISDGDKMDPRKLMEIVKTLPLPDADKLSITIIKSGGKKKDEKRGYTTEQLASWADDFS